MPQILNVALASALIAAALLTSNPVFADTSEAADDMAETQAFLAAPTTLTAAIAAAETATGGKVIAIEYQSGDDGAPDVFMAEVVMADGPGKIVAINPADGAVMKITDDNPDDPADDNGDEGGSDDGGEDGDDDGEEG